MCGPIAFALPINRKNNIKKTALIFLYYFDRLLSYSLISFIFGFLPCGMVYMALVGAIATSNSLYGALYMFLFGLGTIPLMTTAVYLGNILSITVRTKIQKTIPVFVVMIGVLFILRGMGLGIPYISPSDASLTIGNNPVECIVVQ